ncbi:MAG: ABC transporter substrate-binding protein [Draconibacterium sp.]
MNLYRNAALSGKFMVEKFGKRIAIVSGLYDSGYDTISSFRRAVEEAQGTITNTFINDRNNNDFFDQTIHAIKENNNDGLFLLMTGQDANNFVLAYHNAGLSTPVVTTSFVTDENYLPNLGPTMDNVYHLNSWIRNLNTPQNKQFVSDYENEYKAAPNQFSLLGYETGLIAAQIRNKINGNINNDKISVDSPAGCLTINFETGEVKSPAYLCKTLKGSFLLPENQLINQIEVSNDIGIKNIQNKEEIHSGWLNPYLFA